MQFEFIEFYERPDLKKCPKSTGKAKKFIGTVHIYARECQMDIRGIAVTCRGNGMFFHMPHFKALDSKTGQIVRYPHIRWKKEADHEDMMAFLHSTVKPEVKNRLCDTGVA